MGNGCKRIQKLFPTKFFCHAPRALSARASPAPSPHHQSPRSDALEINRRSPNHLISLKNQLAADREREERTFDTSIWSKPTPLRRGTERRTRLKKSWTNLSPNALLESFLAANGPVDELRRDVAVIRSHRMPIVLMQMHLHHECEADPEKNKDLLELLPSRTEWQKIMTIVHENGHSKEDLDNYLYILFGVNDEDRCRRFLEQDTIKPIFLLNFIIRSRASIHCVSTLTDIIKYFQSQALGASQKAGDAGAPDGADLSRSRLAMLNMAPDDFIRSIHRLSDHCRRLEPRLMITLADIVAQRLRWHQHTPEMPKKMYHEQCKLFNNALKIFAERGHLEVRHKQIPNAYLWEAQRILLGTSDQLPKPLLVDKVGFEAIRAVLAGLPKNQAEGHSTRRYSRTWPPYLRPGDGMDEAMEPEDSWTRTVRAGVMMQEAGFSKDQKDEALDVLQGLAIDGTPSIQQRTLLSLKSSFRPWAASIKATRNAHEAWARFNNPPKEGQQPGLDEYAVMFEKLFARDIDPAVGRLPGDNSLNFPTQDEPNLTEFEKARLHPPGVDELYDQMKRVGIAPSGYCLRILVSNAESLEKASRYLLESTLSWEQSSSLLTGDPSTEALKEIPIDILSAYVTACAKQRGQGAKHILRAMHLVEARLGRSRHTWASYLWMPILKALGHSHQHLRISFEEQLRLAVQLLEHVQECHGASSTLFQRFASTLKRILRREVIKLSADMQSNTTTSSSSLSGLYQLDIWQAQGHDRGGEPPTWDEHGDEDAVPLTLARQAATRLKELFNLLVDDEKQRRKLLRPNEASYLDAMLSRQDPVSAPIAHDYMLSLAFAGEFEEMAKVVAWLIREWDQDQLIEELEGLDEMPYEADMVEALCAFRAFAEPILEEATVDSVLDTLNASRVGWTWPDDDQVQGYLDGRHMANKDLREVLEAASQQQRQRKSSTDGAQLEGHEKEGDM
ncbi:hypothetical protein BGZ63DRAFT_418615 [Mariannaea sp. PMI_226]|nr:hypothetical protein BGZ63DRAFT_418615 [Mariannaea sp. PMI_226]